MYTVKTLLESFLYLYAFVAVFLYFAQEIIIFPRLISSKLSRRISHTGRPPQGIESFYAKTSDGEDIEVWTTHKSGEPVKMAAIIFHGNGETVETMNFLKFFTKVGIKAFTFDYRGTGLSSGWPSEKGLYQDAEGVFKAVCERTSLKAENIILLGNSLGSGPASYLASVINPRGLILLSAYADMKTLVKKRFFYKFFSYTARYYLPTSEYVKKLKNSFVILAHGKEDSVIPFSHLGIIKAAVPSSLRLAVFESANSHHKNLYDNIEDSLIEKTKELIA